MATAKKVLPVFLSEKEVHESVKAGKLVESEMETVAEIPLPKSVIGSHPTDTSTLERTARPKKLVIKCKVTKDAVICTSYWR